MGRALERARPLADGRMLASVLTQEDFDAAGGRRHRGHRRGHARGAGGPGRRAGPRGRARPAATGSRCAPSDPAVDVAGDRPARRAGAATGRPPASAPAARPEDLLAWLETPHRRPPRPQRRRWLRRRSLDAGRLAGGQARRAHLARRRGRRPPPARAAGVKVGHCGTLDPFATGLLVVMVGRATRLAPYLTGLDKTYLATRAHRVHVGHRRPRGPDRGVGRARRRRPRWRRCCPGSSGSQPQRVPAYVGRAGRRGAPLPARAPRRGGRAAGARRSRSPPCAWCATWATARSEIEVRCGAGTYVRQLAGDIGERLGCGRLLRRPAAHRRGAAVGGGRRRPGRRWPATGGPRARWPALAHLPVRELSPDASSPSCATAGRSRATRGSAAGRWPWLREGRLVAVARAGRRGRAAAGGGPGGPPLRRYQLARRPAPRRAAARGRDRHLRRRPRGPPGRHPAGDRDRPRPAHHRHGAHLRAAAHRRPAARSCAPRC